ncbi:hypothetical protein P691DRAFT_663483 [Macrolepiota fuliginosa MF-IS2]|uniref:RanBP2-type domain-containing protein n=1 Tax=Macrolepiota fuliginosa MF-IS2 TaxID=1400762 RepID=A0A9P5XKC9_9AGAR|nr:hypothetical protein P691DRAFT_663483 [Macrolepiota fuliginosa MF-IS2]
MAVVSHRPADPLDDILARLHTFADRPGSSSTSAQNTLAYPFSSPTGCDEDSAGPTIIDTFAPRPQPSSGSSSSVSTNDFDSRPNTAQSIRAAIQAFFATRSRVVRLYNIPPSPETVLSAVFPPQPTSRSHSVPVPASLWCVRDEYGFGCEFVVWAVFGTHDEACAALSLPGLPFAVATALESDLEPFHKLKRFVLRPSLPIPPFQLSSSPPSRLPIHLPRPSPMLRVSASHSSLLSPSPAIVIEEPRGGSTEYYTLSTNPPNPKTSFRLGDWICSSPNCAAHNFGRNLSCIGCGCPKSSPTPSQQQQPQQPQQLYSSSNNPMPRLAASPRFSNSPNRSTPTRPGMPANQPAYSTTFAQPQSSRPMGYQPQVSGPPKTAHPLLTPSGRAFAIGGRVQNVSSDPLLPCIMWWPDNEPFPEQGQIRPNGLVGIPQPPILNTGNKGPISHQPGDWICKKCNYLNWRRRKVCQTCLPYAEGNGDSISAAVQAERIALLTSVLAQTELSPNSGEGNLIPPPQQQQPLPRANSVTPPHGGRRPYLDIPESSPQPQAGNRLTPQLQNRIVHKSHSHNQLGTQYLAHTHIQSPPMSVQYTASSPIYQTSGHRQPSPLYSTGPAKLQASHSISSLIETPAPLLPSFLQDIVQSPSLSPTSTTTTTTSSELPFEDEYEEVMNSRHTFPRIRGTSESRSIGGSSDGGSSSSMMHPLSIWRLDGEESKNLLGFPLSNQQDSMGAPGPGVIGSGRKSAQAATL